MKNFNLNLIGKKYIDKILFVENYAPGETNKIIKQETKLGGIYNISSAQINSLNCVCYEYGAKEAIIIVETSASRRSSLTIDIQEGIETQHIIGKSDWTHIAYVDDLSSFDYSLDKNFSIDFCTNFNRNKFVDIISKSNLVFDSRERKSLYNNITTNAPIILHDQNGCECIIKNKKVFESSIKPIKGLNVNGAGDVFAGFFIREYLKKGLKDAVENTPLLTTGFLQEKK